MQKFTLMKVKPNELISRVNDTNTDGTTDIEGTKDTKVITGTDEIGNTEAEV